MSNEQHPTPDLDENLQTAESGQDVEDAGDLQSRVDALSDELVGARDQLIRTQAEMQNVRRRAEQDVEKAHKFGQEKLVNDLLPVVDNLERALACIDIEDEAFKPVIEGIELTLKSFLDTLTRHNIETIDPVGEPFDPQLHQAMAMVPNPDVEPNTVVNVFQKGYSLHGRLVRPAMVVIAKA